MFVELMRQARGINRHPRPLSTARPYTAQPVFGFLHRSCHGTFVHTSQEAAQRGEIGYALQSQNLAQFAMFSQAHLGLAKGTILVAHQAENGRDCGWVNWRLLKRVR